ncbi:MAG: hypothetical protein ACJAUH_002200, partial [Saprospiraceae bacterium]
VNSIKIKIDNILILMTFINDYNLFILRQKRIDDSDKLLHLV